MKVFPYILLVMVMVSCSSKKPLTEAQKASLDTAVNVPAFRIDVQWAYPLSVESAQLLNSLQPAGAIANGNRILIDNGTAFLEVQRDSVFINLPYFGTRQISGGQPGNTSIQVDDIYEEWKEETTKRADEKSLRLETEQKGERYDISIRLFGKGNATVVVNSTQRQSIRYQGTWKAIEE